MQQQPEDIQPQQNEFDLLDILRILRKRKVLIISGTLIMTIGAAIISLLLPKVYEVSMIFEPAKIETGRPGETAYAISPESIRESIVGDAYDYRIRQELNIPFDQYPKIKASIPKGTSIVKVAINAKVPGEAIDILSKMLVYIDGDFNQRLEYERGRIENEIKSTRIKNEAVVEKLQLTKGQIDETYKKIKTLETNKLKALSTSVEGAMHVLLYSNEIQNQQVYLNGLQEKLKNLEEEARGADIRIDNLQLELSRLKGMNVLKPVTVTDMPVKPKKTLIVMLTFILSLLSTIALSFFIDHIEHSKSRQR